MNVLLWILFGLVAGLIAQAIDPRRNNGGILGTLVLGIAGALVGGFLASLIFGVGVTGFNLTSLIIAVLGAIILLYLGRAIRKAS